MTSSLMLSFVLLDLGSEKMSSTEDEVGSCWASGRDGSSCSWLMELVFSEATCFFGGFFRSYRLSPGKNVTCNVAFCNRHGISD